MEDFELFKKEVSDIDTMIENRIVETEKEEIIYDGIVNIDLYYTTNPKILWILKEPYDNPDGTGGDWSLTQDFLNVDDFYHRIGRSRATWHPVIYVSYGILNNFLFWDDMDYIRDDPEMALVLKKIAVINVRKLPGFRRTWDRNRIPNAYDQYKDILLLQIETYKPNIIIGGSTLHLFKNDLGLGDFTSNGSVSYWMSESTIYFDAYHPGQTVASREDYVNDIIGVAKMWYSQKK